MKNPFLHLNDPVDQNMNKTEKKINKILRSYDRIPKKWNTWPSSKPRGPIMQHMPLINLHRKINQQQSESEHILAHNTTSKYNIQHVYSSSSIKQPLDTLIKTEPDIWKKIVSNEFGRLAQGVRDISGNNVIDFISKKHIPIN